MEQKGKPKRDFWLNASHVAMAVYHLAQTACSSIR